MNNQETGSQGSRQDSHQNDEPMQGDRPMQEDESRREQGAEGASSGSGDPAGSGQELAGQELARVRAEAADFKDKYLRALAEIENVTKRARKERSDLIRYNGESIVVELLEVLDGFERAMEHADADPATVIGGLKMIHRQFVDALGRFEIRGESSIGKPFDPNRQRAIGTSIKEGAQPGQVLSEVKKAYMYRDKLIRPGEVLVAGEAADSGKKE